MRSGVVFAIALSASTAHAFEVETIQETGSPESRYDIAFLGDGYTESQQLQFGADVDRAALNLFAQDPFRRFGQMFNIYAVGVVSGDFPALGSRYDCGVVGGTFCVDNDAVQAVVAEHVPRADLVVVIYNDSSVSDATAGQRSGGPVRMTRIALTATTHELGHAIAGLGDEYGDIKTVLDPPPPCDPVLDCPEPNLTIDPSGDRWSHWGNRVSAYEGGRYQDEGIWRPWVSCKMRENSSPFCPVCREQVNLSMWRHPDVGMIGRAEPLPGLVETTDPIRISLELAPIDPAYWEILWAVDGDSFAVETETVHLDLPAGEHTVTAFVRDATPDVRLDPDGDMQESVSWTVVVLPKVRDAGAPSRDAEPQDSGSTEPEAGIDASSVPTNGPVTDSVDSDSAEEASNVVDAGHEDPGDAAPGQPETETIRDAEGSPVAVVDADTDAEVAIHKEPDSGAQGQGREGSVDPVTDTGGCACGVGRSSVPILPWVLVPLLVLRRRH